MELDVICTIKNFQFTIAAIISPIYHRRPARRVVKFGIIRRIEKLLYTNQSFPKTRTRRLESHLLMGRKVVFLYNESPSLHLCVGLGEGGVCIGSDDASNRHEEPAKSACDIP